MAVCFKDLTLKESSKGTDPKMIQDIMGLKDARLISIYNALAKEVVLGNWKKTLYSKIAARFI